MNIMLALVSVCLLCTAIGLFAAVKNHLIERRLAKRNKLRYPIVHVSFICLVLASMPLAAQEVIHAQAGHVVAVNTAAKTLTLKLPDGSVVTYRDLPTHAPEFSLDKTVREKTVPVATYSNVGGNVVVLYFGYDAPTAVAIKEMAPDAAKKCTGSVASFDRSHHALVLQTDAAAPETLTLNDDTIVDTNDGVVKLADYKPAKGKRFRCFTSSNSEVALLVVPE